MSKSTIQNYLLHNDISDSSFNNEASKNYMIEKMTGGQCCVGGNVFKETLKEVTKMVGGRVSLPIQYFGAPNNGLYKPTVSYTKTGSLTPHIARQALPSTQFGGSTRFNTVEEFLKKRYNKESQKELMKMYHNKLDKFVHNVNELSGGGRKPITKTLINDALKKLKMS